MKILLISALYPPAVGGAATYFGDIAPVLSQSRQLDHVFVLSERMPGQPVKSVLGSLSILRLLPTRVSLARHARLIRAVTYVLTQLWFATHLPELSRLCGADVVHFHTRYRGLLFYHALDRCGVPVIADLRDKMTDPALLSDVAERLVCCGEGIVHFAVDAGFPRGRVSLVPVPFSLPNLPSASAVSSVREQCGIGQDPYLLYVGDITYNKGVYDLLEAHRRWKVEHPSVALILAGPNREGRRFLEEARRTEGALYLGSVSHREAMALMRGAEIVLLPSRSEGLPRVILEAISLGRKVICPPGIPEFDRYLPEYVLPEVNVDAIARSLDAVWNRQDSPRYPFDEHELGCVIDKLVSVYAGVARRIA